MSRNTRSGNLKLDQLLRGGGWEPVRNSKHRIYHCPCGVHSLSVPHSPDSDHWRGKVMSAMRRCAES